jgi:predicted amino acid racemase
VTSPRIEIDLDRIGRNAEALVRRCAERGISVTAITKALRGLPALGRVLLDAGAVALGDSRIDNIERLRAAGIDAPIVLIRSASPSEVERVVAAADVSAATEVEIVALLSAAATRARRVHGIMLMVELGDLREGIMPADLSDVVARCLAMPGIELRGVGANLACRNGVVADDRNMGELSDLARSVEDRFGLTLDFVSGGNSANLEWARTTAHVGRIDNLRLGESILLGVDPRDGTPLPGLRQDTATITAEVIESKHKPRQAWGTCARTPFAPVDPTIASAPSEAEPGGWHSLLALGHQDTDPLDLTPPTGLRIIGASSDHLVIASDHRLDLGREIGFRPGYSALVRAMGARSVRSVTTGPPPSRSTWRPMVSSPVRAAGQRMSVAEKLAVPASGSSSSRPI